MEKPFKVAVMVADWFDRSAPVATVKVAEVVFAATLTKGGTVSSFGAPLEIATFESATTVLPGADLDKVTVHVAAALEARVVGAH